MFADKQIIAIRIIALSSCNACNSHKKCHRWLDTLPRSTMKKMSYHQQNLHGKISF